MTSPPPLCVRRRSDDIETPVSALLKLGPEQAGIFLFESVLGGEQRGRYSVIGMDPDLWWRTRAGIAETSDGPDFSIITHTSRYPLQDMRRFTNLCRTRLEDGLPPMAAGAFGHIGYDMVRHMERLPATNKGGADIPDAILMRPRIILIFDSVTQEILLITPLHDGDKNAANARLDAVETLLDQPFSGQRRPNGKAQKCTFTPNITRERFLEIVELAKTYIRAGDVFQVVPSQCFTTPFSLPPINFYRALRRLNPSPFLFYLNQGSFQIIGSSPEILVRTRSGHVAIRPLAGTMPRGKTRAEDEANAQKLLSDPKERAEHMMLLDLGRNDVGRVAAPGSVRVLQSFFVERYSHVMHIASHVEGRLKSGADAIDALIAGFPAGTLSGAPKIRAMEIIDQLETRKRGVYAGGVGYFGANGDMDMCIALRTALIHKQTLHAQAGAGIVIDSEPEKEYQECLDKAGALFRAAEETARYQTNNESRT